jgi:hypothetical protein
MEIEQKSQFSSQQIQVVKAQMASKARENRMLQLTASEVGALPKDTHVYEGVGKMYVFFCHSHFNFQFPFLTSNSWQLRSKRNSANVLNKVRTNSFTRSHGSTGDREQRAG